MSDRSAACALAEPRTIGGRDALVDRGQVGEAVDLPGIDTAQWVAAFGEGGIGANMREDGAMITVSAER